jgi:hypothetical protein
MFCSILHVSECEHNLTFSFAGASSADFSGVFSVCFFAFLADFFAA